mgnify:CR=1 FL=1
MYAQSRTKAVPYGFICGFPVQGVGSELYGFYEGQGGKGGRQGEAVVAAMKHPKDDDEEEEEEEEETNL